MNTKLVNSAAGVILAALTQNRTAAGIALALDSAQLLMTPEKAVELAELRRQLESSRVDGRRLIRAEQRCAELEAVLGTHRKDDQAVIERLRARVAELEQRGAEAPVAVALTPKAAESADKLTALFAPTQALREGAPAPTAVTCADHDPAMECTDGKCTCPCGKPCTCGGCCGCCTSFCSHTSYCESAWLHSGRDDA